MTATDELRRMLDERGVEWSYGGFYHSTYFVIDDVYYSAYEQHGKLYLKTSVGPITPEQAIDAILGRGTCEIYRTGNTRDVRKCSACGKQMHFDHPLDRDCLHYCPNCGAKVVNEV